METKVQERYLIYNFYRPEMPWDKNAKDILVQATIQRVTIIQEPYSYISSPPSYIVVVVAVVVNHTT